MSRFAFFNRSNTIHLTSSDSPQKPHILERSDSLGNSIRGRMVKKLSSIFETSKSSKLSSPPSSTSSSQEPVPNSKPKGSEPFTLFRLPGSEDRVVVYFTSLRGVRRTFEDCNAVRMILKGFRVWVDERDVSLDGEFRRELQRVLGEKNVALPQVFVRGKYVGGADVIKHLFEVGELGKVLEGIPRTKPGGFVCGGCGGVRFMPCLECSGSRKVFDEDEGVLKRCLHCNENGLMRCPDCYY